MLVVNGMDILMQWRLVLGTVELHSQQLVGAGQHVQLLAVGVHAKRGDGLINLLSVRGLVDTDMRLMQLVWGTV